MRVPVDIIHTASSASIEVVQTKDDISKLALSRQDHDTLFFKDSKKENRFYFPDAGRPLIGDAIRAANRFSASVFNSRTLAPAQVHGRPADRYDSYTALPAQQSWWPGGRQQQQQLQRQQQYPQQQYPQQQKQTLADFFAAEKYSARVQSVANVDDLRSQYGAGVVHDTNMEGWRSQSSRIGAPATYKNAPWSSYTPNTDKNTMHGTQFTGQISAMPYKVTARAGQFVGAASYAQTTSAVPFEQYRLTNRTPRFGSAGQYSQHRGPMAPLRSGLQSQIFNGRTNSNKNSRSEWLPHRVATPTTAEQIGRIGLARASIYVDRIGHNAATSQYESQANQPVENDIKPQIIQTKNPAENVSNITSILRPSITKPILHGDVIKSRDQVTPRSYRSNIMSNTKENRSSDNNNKTSKAVTKKGDEGKHLGALGRPFELAGDDLNDEFDGLLNNIH